MAYYSSRFGFLEKKEIHACVLRVHVILLKRDLKLLVYEALSLTVFLLKLLVYEALSLTVFLLKLLVYEALNLIVFLLKLLVYEASSLTVFLRHRGAFVPISKHMKRMLLKSHS